MPNFEPSSQSLFFKSPRPQDTRIGEYVKAISEEGVQRLKEPGTILLGYPDDEGIRANFGRVGSADGPDAIRSAFFKLAPGREDFPPVYDLGNFSPREPLTEKQKMARQVTKNIFSKKHKLFSLGGGNDYAYPDIAGFLDVYGAKSPLVVSLDAHLDVRPTVNGPNSGTAFYQLLEEFKGLDLVDIGIQPCANSRTHMKYATQKKVRVFQLSESRNQLAKIFKNLSKTKKDMFLAIDIDVFSSAYAPGCSAAAPIGLDPNEFMDAIPKIIKQYNVHGVGVYEMSPPLDRDQQTAKLAAQLIHNFILNF